MSKVGRNQDDLGIRKERLVIDMTPEKTLRAQQSSNVGLSGTMSVEAEETD